ncbi:MAG: T9SS type A sorting domain-containing protein [Flavobacteriales bacterium]|nr:T9SS type A sorting domain-containing protein [Flavobacteriales bacterium]MCB0809992.1 T9SS type A sorting domain-containing protein [Flavobacteriales bacterium]MCB0813226.1 T9SS type A sorting domain-containing protein [Flavobacteriales bacterium]
MRGLRGISIMALVMAPMLVSAQAYVPLLKPNASWQDEHACASMGPNTGKYECFRYYLAGDTLFNDTTYQVLRRTGRKAHTDILYPDQSYVNYHFEELVAFLREDTTERRVYIKYPPSAFTYLFYDFSVGVGPYPDTYRYGSGKTVGSIDTLWLNDGPHRRFNFQPIGSFIEGVGGEQGFLERTIVGEVCWMDRLVCHVPVDSANYIVPSDDCPCYSNVSVPEWTEQAIHVFPSPTTGQFHMQGAPASAPFLLRALDGRVVGSGTCSGDGSATIDLSFLPGALYLLEVGDGERVRRVKVLKQ